jgi:hypothetical protein
MKEKPNGRKNTLKEKRPLGRPRQNEKFRSMWVGIGSLGIGSSGEFSEDYFENEVRPLPKLRKFLTK